MPSLVYITRIRPLSAELAQALESAGSHIKSFGPGEITADECILVMTSEAVLAGLQAAGLASVSTEGAARGKASQAAPPLQDLQKHLGTEAAVWDCIKASRLGESGVGESTAASAQGSGLPALAPAADDLGIVASQAGLRVLAAQQNADAAQKGAGGNHNSGVSGRPADGQPHKRFWQLAVMAATLLTFAVVLLAGRASILSPTADIAAVDKRNPGVRTDSHAAGLARKRSTLRSQPPQPSNRLETPADVVAEVRRHISDYDFVAADYTTHFDQHAQPGATPQNPDLRRGAQNRLIRKRVVVD
jgi:hypothetical protein